MKTHDEYRDDLPLYAVGALSSDEMEDLKLHLADCRVCAQELAALDQAAAQIAMAAEPVTPSENVRKRLMAAIESEPVRASGRVSPSTGEKRPAAPHSAAHSAAWSSWFWVPAFTTAVLLLAIAGLLRRDRELQRANQDLEAQLKVGAQTAQQAQNVVDTLAAADAMHVTLVATGARVQPEAKTVYSPRQRSLLLLASNLSPLPENKTYELWLLPVDGTAPVPAGTFKPDARGSATLVFSQFAGPLAAKGFAVTVESDPGSSAPTMPIILSGTV